MRYLPLLIRLLMLSGQGQIIMTLCNPLEALFPTQSHWKLGLQHRNLGRWDGSQFSLKHLLTCRSVVKPAQLDHVKGLIILYFYTISL